jgi:formylglycine-generating enzyme required for sulfatase activity
LSKDQNRTAVNANPAPALFIAEALDLCFAKKYAIPEQLKETFRRLCLGAIEDEIALQARQALGLCLGRLGDPRIFDLRDLHAHVEVPAGTYHYGKKGKTITIAAPFLIGRYPVTNSQYQAFMDSGGYRDRKWWSDAGWAWLQESNVVEPAYWRNERWNGPNQPVVGVSFWEAEACSAWAGGRLPRDEEWEVVARGPHGYEYPWGNDWQEGICNLGVGLGVTSPVGLFPRWAQAELGIEDLAGNVCEWCGSLYEPVDRQKPDAARVLRGGSWYSDQNYEILPFRIGGYPYSRYNNFGFRVICSSPSSATDQ